IWPHIDVYERPAELAGNLRAQPVHFIIMTLNPNDGRAIDERVQNLALLQVRWNKHKGFHSSRGRIGGHGVRQVARRGTGDRVETELLCAAESNAHHTYLE